MRYIAVTLTVMLLLAAGGVAAEEDRTQVPPRQYEWSVTKAFDAAHNVYSDARPVLRDGAGNYHLPSFVEHEDGFMLEYTVLNKEGEELSSTDAHIPNLTNMAAPVLVPEGLLVVWGDYETIPTEDEIGKLRLYAATVTAEGEVLEHEEIEYHLPEGTPMSGLDMFEMVWRVNAAVDSSGNIHVTVQGGDRGMFRIYYFQFTPQFEQIMVDSSGINSNPNEVMGGEIVLDGEDNAHIIYSHRENVWLLKFSSAGEKVYEEEVARHIFVFGNEPTSEYTRRGRAPAFAVDDDGTVHIAHNYLVQAGMGQKIVDVKYIQVKEGKVELEKTLTTSMGRFRFPTMTLVGDRVTVAWEQSMGPGQQQLFYSTMNLNGEVLFERVPLTFNESFNSSGLVWAYPGNHFTAAWWLGTGSDRQVAFKNTFDPVELTMWHQFGVVDDFSNRGPVEQVAYWFVMVFLLAAVRLFANLHVILIVAGTLYILYRLQLLEALQSRPWRLLAVALLGCYVLGQPLEVAESVAGEGYYLFSALVATLMVVAGSLLLNLKYHNSLNLIFGCLAWLYLVMMVQVMPVVPNLIGV